MEEKKKVSYDELQDIANQLSMQLNQSRKQITQMSSVLTKLPYLFKVIENKDVFDNDFVLLCVEEIKSIMMPSEEIEEKDE